MDRIAPELTICPKRRFFLRTFTYVTFVDLLSSITMQRFKKAVRADSEILALRKVEPKITHLPQKRIFVKKISLIWLLSTFYYNLHTAKIKKKSEASKSVAIKMVFFSSFLSCIRSSLFLYLPFTVLSIFLH